jgi:hypothetical protein
MRFSRSYDATITRGDFLRVLPQATGCDSIRVDGDRFSGPGWSLLLTSIPPLSIGMFRLERHRIEIAFEGMPADDQERFMDRFTLYFQRGGG